MKPFGEYLKQAREKQGLSLEQIASQTRIQEQHLHALETEDFGSLPAKVFVKGFVRSYSRSLGLDEEKVLQRFLESSGNFYEQNQEEQRLVQITLETAHRRTFNWKLVVILFVIVAVSLWLWLPEQQKKPLPPSQSTATLPIQSSQESEAPSPIQPTGIPPIQPLKTAPAPSSSAGIPATPQRKPILPPTTIPRTPEPPVPPEGEAESDESQVLEIEATQLTWVVVQSDQQAPHEALLQPGQRVTWKAKKQFLLTLGNAAGVVVRLNGESRGPFGKPGQVVRDIRVQP